MTAPNDTKEPSAHSYVSFEDEQNLYYGDENARKPCLHCGATGKVIGAKVRNCPQLHQHFETLKEIIRKQESELQRLREAVDQIQEIYANHSNCANDYGDLEDGCSLRIEIGDLLAKFDRGE